MKHEQSQFIRPPSDRPTPAKAAYTASSADAALVEDRVRRFLPMVRRAAWHIYGNGRDGLEVEDLVQAGLIALTECARRHDAPTEDGFAAYAKIRVRGAMFDIVRKLLPDGRTAARRRRIIADARARLELQLGRAPDVAELAAQSGLSEADVILHDGAATHLVQLDGAYDDSSEAFADDTPDPFALLAEIEDSSRLAGAIAALPDRLKLVLQLYFVEELNLAEIAEVLEVSVPRVHQIKAQALKAARDLLEDG
ncbi:RNA polymerase sigma factor FliA [Alteripontixanthobacter maritimus]|uniref:RNA polymerase sigma factor FliA n=1 Tax=Alteripontixanthobacter maritimus TaxID=2161824 RepID=A0A369Q6M5_9SPHN|nr:sigma-70 family RNA polymerase sigma factor [Alteripontixanthobacter maritimus]RDC59165.1 RNA polymerase sigma factor FliA [Alteripontixanthobacter maritimus]